LSIEIIDKLYELVLKLLSLIVKLPFRSPLKIIKP